MSRPCICNRFTPGEPYRQGDCARCWLYHHDESFRRTIEGPGFLQKAAHLAGAVVRHVASGAGNVSEEVYQERLALCRACTHLAGQECSLCGCPVARKCRWASESCPLPEPKWKAVMGAGGCGCKAKATPAASPDADR